MAIEIVPPIVTGLLAGAIDLFFMIKDETGDAKKIIGHGLASFIPLTIFSFISFNIGLITSLGFMQSLPSLLSNQYAIIGAMVLISAIVVHSKSAVFGKGPGSHETWIHSFMVAGIVAAGPLMWPYIQSYVPFQTGIGTPETAAP